MIHPAAKSVSDEDDLNVCSFSTIQNCIICDAVIPLDLENGSKVPLLDGSEKFLAKS